MDKPKSAPELALGDAAQASEMDDENEGVQPEVSALEAALHKSSVAALKDGAVASVRTRRPTGLRISGVELVCVLAPLVRCDAHHAVNCLFF